jgi:hypothetical protein
MLLLRSALASAGAPGRVAAATSVRAGGRGLLYGSAGAPIAAAPASAARCGLLAAGGPLLGAGRLALGGPGASLQAQLRSISTSTRLAAAKPSEAATSADPLSMPAGGAAAGAAGGSRDGEGRGVRAASC